MITPVKIAGKELTEFCAKMQSYPEISPCDVDANVFQGSNRSTVQLLSNRRGKRSLKCKIDFFGKSNFERTMHQSRFESLFLGTEPIVIDIGDGFWYRGVLTDIGKPSTDHELITTVEYTFQVTRHMGQEVTIDITQTNDVIFNCVSNVAKTDCVITLADQFRPDGTHNVTVEMNGYRWYVDHGFDGGLVIDGVNKRFLINNQNAASEVKWTDFPFLTPGENNLKVYVDGVVPPGIFAHVNYTPTFL